MSTNNTPNAILSPKVEHAMGELLKSKDIKFFIIYRIGIETGMPCNKILNLKVSELKGRSELSYPPKNPKSSNKETVVPLSPLLIKQIEEFLHGKPDNSYAFCGQDGVTKLQITTFQNVIAKVASKCGQEGITPISLRKTYIYHLYLKYGDVNTIRNMLHLSSNQKVYEYLGLEEPFHLSQYTPDYKFALCNSNLIDKTEEHLQEVFEYMRSVYKEPSTNDTFYAASMDFLKNIDALLQIYRNKAYESTPTENRGTPL